MFENRPYNGDDLQKICAFPKNEEELFFFFPRAVYPLTLCQLQSAIKQRSDATVVELNGNVAGFANFYRWQSGTCNIGNLIIAPWARGKGAAKFLVKTMINLAVTRHSAINVHVSCFNRNTSGLLLYEKLGFKPFDIEGRRNYDGSQVALIHMQYRVERPGQTVALDKTGRAVCNGGRE